MTEERETRAVNCRYMSEGHPCGGVLFNTCENPTAAPPEAQTTSPKRSDERQGSMIDTVRWRVISIMVIP